MSGDGCAPILRARAGKGASGRSELPAPQPCCRCEGLREQLTRMRLQLDRVQLELDAAVRMAGHDELTGLPNRRALDLMGRRALADGDGGLAAVVFIDLDGFKSINDRYGHAVGDTVLRIVAHRLRRAVRHDDRVFRVGGDEFVCVLLDLPSAQRAQAIGEHIVRMIAGPCRVSGERLSLSASLGVAVHGRGRADMMELARSADAAMYRAKSTGGGMAFAAVAGAA